MYFNVRKLIEHGTIRLKISTRSKSIKISYFDFYSNLFTFSLFASSLYKDFHNTANIVVKY